jgi:hypothetical protein
MKKSCLTGILIILPIVLFVYSASSKQMEDIEQLKGRMLNQAIARRAANLPGRTLPCIVILTSLPAYKPGGLEGLYFALGFIFLFTTCIPLILFHYSGLMPCSRLSALSIRGWNKHLLTVTGIHVIRREWKGLNKEMFQMPMPAVTALLCIRSIMAYVAAGRYYAEYTPSGFSYADGREGTVSHPIHHRKFALFPGVPGQDSIT